MLPTNLKGKGAERLRAVHSVLDTLSKPLARSGTPADTHVASAHAFAVSVPVILGLAVAYGFVATDTTCARHVFRDEEQRVVWDRHLVAACSAYGHLREPQGAGQGSRVQPVTYNWMPYFIMAIAGVLSAPYMVRWQYSTDEQEYVYTAAPLATKWEAKKAAQMAVGASCGALCSQLGIDAVCVLTDLTALLLADIASGSVFSNLLTSRDFGDLSAVRAHFARAFPGAVYCKVGPQMVMAGANTEGYGCGLPLNNYYKYVSVLLFALALVLLCGSLLSMLYHAVLALPCIFSRRWVSCYTNLSESQRNAMLAAYPKDTLFTLRCLGSKMSRAATHALHKAMTLTADGKRVDIPIDFESRLTEPAKRVDIPIDFESRLTEPAQWADITLDLQQPPLTEPAKKPHTVIAMSDSCTFEAE